MTKAKVIGFGRYFEPMERARARAADLTGRMEKLMDSSVIPPELDPFRGRFQEEVTKILFESELLAEQLKAGRDAGGGDR